MGKEMKSVLLVGGPFDGHWKEVDTSLQVVEVMHSDLVPVENWPANGPPPSMPSSTTFTRHAYTRTTWSVSENEYNTPGSRFVYVAVTDRISTGALFDKLLEGYTLLARYKRMFGDL